MAALDHMHGLRRLIQSLRTNDLRRTGRHARLEAERRAEQRAAETEVLEELIAILLRRQCGAVC